MVGCMHSDGDVVSNRTPPSINAVRHGSMMEVLGFSRTRGLG